MSFDSRRRDKLVRGRLRVMRRNVDELMTLFADKSYALTRENHFVPLTPRHMTNSNWQELFWHQPRKLVIRGREYKSLCSVCLHALDCIRKKENWDFECQITTKTIDIQLRGGRRRRK